MRRLAGICLAGLFLLSACKQRLGTTGGLNLAETPVQVVRDISIVDTENGRLKMRMNGGRMERYEQDTLSYELFPEGFNVYSYLEDGRLETTIVADQARHNKSSKGKEVWKAYGNVKITNIINQEVMETDTIYWDREKELIHTECYVKMYSPDGFMQGYGMTSDQRARNSVIHKPFNSYGFVDQDEEEPVDSINFIGPFPLKGGVN